MIRVNYGALNVEEFGSVYEGLLEYSPVFVHDGRTERVRLCTGRRARRDRVALHRRRSGAAAAQAFAGLSDRRLPERARPGGGAAGTACRRYLLRLWPYSAGRRAADCHGAGQRAHRRGAAVAGRVSHGGARCDPHLYLRRGPQPAGCRTVQGGPVAGGPQPRRAAQLPRPSHQVRQRHRRFCAPGRAGQGRARRSLCHAGRRR